MAGRAKKKSANPVRKRSRKSESSQDPDQATSPERSPTAPTTLVGSPNKRAKRESAKEINKQDSLLVDVLTRDSSDMIQGNMHILYLYIVEWEV